MKNFTIIKIIGSIISFIGFIVILSLLASKVIRADMVSTTQYHEVACKLDNGVEAKDCIKLEELSYKLKNFTEKMTFNEVVYCSLIKAAKLGLFESNCSTFDSAKELQREIEIIKEAFSIVKKT